MNNKQRQQMRAESDRHWAEMRENEAALLGILTMRKPTELDALWGLGCVGLVHNDITLYKEDLGEEETNKIIESSSEKSISNIKTFLDDIGNFKKISKNDISVEKKQEIIDTMRKRMWNDMLREDIRLTYLMNNFGDIRDEMDMLLLYKCVSLVCFELKIRDLEIKILEGEF
jgi:hypothetical protein